MFEELGMGFIVSMLGDLNLDTSMFVRLRIDSAPVMPLRLEFGNPPKMNLIHSLQYMQYVLGNGYFDPRWDSSALSEN